ncbi:neuronal acetylcholine receptor subunit alpha-4 [Limosa lapponica baueri]|uniref:Neuronal acetylcholine receptor subunit alpha-4 n=1 Tax=Limosa lapponica baueri TaxID=1758121 RepID=A0A2I0U888_LIMLA|nr:neuronal acetylcholine receptor subunit alpha-4 [Limosa lapponica baueri]
MTSLDLLATLFLMHVRIPLAFLATRAHCCFMVNFLATRTPKSLSAELQDPTPILVEFHQVPLSPTFWPVHVSLYGSKAFWCVSHSSQFCIISKVAEGTLCPLIQVIDEYIEQDLIQYRPPKEHC